jgi:hypothetical protein
LVPGVFGLGAAADGDDEDDDEDGDEDDDGVGADAATGVDVGVEVDVVEDVADVAEISATLSAAFSALTCVFVVLPSVLIVRPFADVALGLVLVFAFPMGVGRALGFSLDLGRLVWALAFGRRLGEGVLRLDFMGVVWRGLRGLVVTLSQCHSHAWELTVWRKQSTDSRFTGQSSSP